jgi:RNA polymerase sigma-70 factor, ECF subfamily
MPDSAESDEDLMLAYAAGDAGAFDLLYARHKGGVYRYLLRHCRQSAIAEELFQDVWSNLIRARASYAPTAKFTTWLYRLAHNRWVDQIRAEGHLTLVSADDEAQHDVVAAIPASRGDEPQSRVENRELAQRLRAAIASLPPAQRDAFLLQQEGGLSLAEIAELTAAGVETVKSRIRYAAAKLRYELRREARDLDDPLREELG